MAKEWYREINFRAKSLRMINWLNKVIANYQQQGLKLTLRQMYYVGVSQNVYPNSERSYKNLGNLVSDARLAGLMDWDAIEDRVRRPRVPSEFSGVEQLIDTASYWYRLPRWEGQENYVELWVEKDYPHLIYLGDMDPSGEDMVRDISDRLEMYNVGDLNVTKVALTMDQVESYKPPPNPAKMSDSRAAKYVDKHGTSSWEVDALPPAALSKIIRDELSSLVDRSLMDKIIEQENKDKQAVREMARAYAEKQKKPKEKS